MRPIGSEGDRDRERVVLVNVVAGRDTEVAEWRRKGVVITGGRGPVVGVKVGVKGSGKEEGGEKVKGGGEEKGDVDGIGGSKKVVWPRSSAINQV